MIDHTEQPVAAFFHLIVWTYTTKQWRTPKLDPGLKTLIPKKVTV